ARLQYAALLLFALPGTPFIYYGEELGLHGAPSPGTTRPWSRNPMQWNGSAGRGFTTGTAWAPSSADTANVADQVGRPGSMLETYRGLVTIRKNSPALTHGAYREVPTDLDAVLAFVREDPAERILIAMNFGAA